jgi:hypothetical protein
LELYLPYVVYAVIETAKGQYIMTVKVVDNVIWETFGFGMIVEKLNNDPTTQDDPFIVFTHKLAAAGRFHNGEPILTPKQEKEVQKDCEAMVALLSKFNHTDDYVKVDQVPTRKPRQTADASETKATETQEGVKVKAVAKKATPPKSEPEMKSEEPKVAEAPRVKRKYTRKAKTEEAPVKKATGAKKLTKPEGIPVPSRGRRKKEPQVLEAA